jgi:hypothetical protein
MSSLLYVYILVYSADWKNPSLCIMEYHHRHHKKSLLECVVSNFTALITYSDTTKFHNIFRSTPPPPKHSLSWTFFMYFSFPHSVQKFYAKQWFFPALYQVLILCSIVRETVRWLQMVNRKGFMRNRLRCASNSIPPFVWSVGKEFMKRVTQHKRFQVETRSAYVPNGCPVRYCCPHSPGT